MAKRAGLPFGIRRGAGTMARLAAFEFRESDFLLTTVSGFFEFQFKVVPQIRAALRAGWVPAAATSAEELLEDVFHGASTECFAKDIERIDGSPSSPARPPARVEGIMTILLVSRALLRIAQRLVRLAHFLEFFLGGVISRVFVRMILQGELPISLFDLLVVRTL
jgi:hypothetical protein